MLFLTVDGEPLSVSWLTDRVSAYVRESGVGKVGSCHLFRHTMAALMLEGGADLRFIQEMLGHADPKTTQIYTLVSIKKLQAVHAASHPGAKLARATSAAEPAVDEPRQDASAAPGASAEPRSFLAGDVGEDDDGER